MTNIWKEKLYVGSVGGPVFFISNAFQFKQVPLLVFSKALLLLPPPPPPLPPETTFSSLATFGDFGSGSTSGKTAASSSLFDCLAGRSGTFAFCSCLFTGAVSFTGASTLPLSTLSSFPSRALAGSILVFASTFAGSWTFDSSFGGSCLLASIGVRLARFKLSEIIVSLFSFELHDKWTLRGIKKTTLTAVNAIRKLLTFHF